ncbi:MAG: ATP-grasp domain-containing protein [Candidatus Bathyarchaeia archaeon]
MTAKLSLIRTAVGSPPAAGLIVLLRARGVRVIGTDSNPFSSGLYLASKGYVVPEASDPQYLDELLKISDKEKPKLIISGPEEETLKLSKNRTSFDERRILLLCPDHATASTFADKIKTHESFTRFRIPTPEIYDVDSARFPCILKPRFGRGGRQVFKVENREELNALIRRVSDPVVQEYVDGEEYSVDTFADMGANPLSVVPRLRLRVESGVSVKGMTVQDEEIIHICEQMVKDFKLAGPACIQCVKREGELRFTEVNTRFGGGSILSMKADPSIVSNIIRLGLGRTPIRSKGFRAGLVMLRYYSEVYLSERQVKKSIMGKGKIG